MGEEQQELAHTIWDCNEHMAFLLNPESMTENYLNLGHIRQLTDSGKQKKPGVATLSICQCTYQYFG